MTLNRRRSSMKVVHWLGLYNLVLRIALFWLLIMEVNVNVNNRQLLRNELC